MGAYRCDICEGYYCSHDVICHESPVTKFGLICDDCEINIENNELEELKEKDQH